MLQKTEAIPLFQCSLFKTAAFAIQLYLRCVALWVCVTAADGGELFCCAVRRDGNSVPGQRRPEPGGNIAETIGATIYNAAPGCSAAWQRSTRIPSSFVPFPSLAILLYPQAHLSTDICRQPSEQIR